MVVVYMCGMISDAKGRVEKQQINRGKIPFILTVKNDQRNIKKRCTLTDKSQDKVKSPRFTTIKKANVYNSQTKKIAKINRPSK